MADTLALRYRAGRADRHWIQGSGSSSGEPATRRSRAISSGSRPSCPGRPDSSALGVDPAGVVGPGGLLAHAQRAGDRRPGRAGCPRRPDGDLLPVAGLAGDDLAERKEFEHLVRGQALVRGDLGGRSPSALSARISRARSSSYRATAVRRVCCTLDLVRARHPPRLAAVRPASTRLAGHLDRRERQPAECGQPARPARSRRSRSRRAPELDRDGERRAGLARRQVPTISPSTSTPPGRPSVAPQVLGLRPGRRTSSERSRAWRYRSNGPSSRVTVGCRAVEPVDVSASSQRRSPSTVTSTASSGQRAFTSLTGASR